MAGIRVMSQPARLNYMSALCLAVAAAGKRLAEMEPSRITDTVQCSGHQFSTLDEQGKLILRQEIERYLGSICEAFMEESDIQLGVSEASGYPLVIGDAVEGSTNAKRSLSSVLGQKLRRPILAGTSAMLLEGPKMSTTIATAFYDWASGDVISSVRAEVGFFIAFINNEVVFPKDAAVPPRDSQEYAIVPGYSHTNVRNRGEALEKLLAAGIRTDGETRSSAQDLLQVLIGQADAYVDVRELFTRTKEDRDQVLRAWDVGALLPVLDALGFITTNQHGQSWQEKSFGDSLTLIVARSPELWKKIRTAIDNLSWVRDLSSDNSNSIILPLSS